MSPAARFRLHGLHCVGALRARYNDLGLRELADLGMVNRQRLVPGGRPEMDEPCHYRLTPHGRYAVEECIRKEWRC